MGGNNDRLRKKLAERDGDHCHYCGKLSHEVHDGFGNFAGKFTLDHVIPRSQGGTRVQANLVLSCYRCNHKRRDIDYLEYAEFKGIDREVRMTIWKNAVESHAQVAGVWFPALPRKEPDQ